MSDPTKTDQEILTELSKRFPAEVVRRLPRGGKAFDYVKTPEIIKRLNATLGLQWEISTEQIIPVSYPDRTEILKAVLPALLQKYDDPVEAADKARRVADELMDIEGFIALGELRVAGHRKGQVGFCDLMRAPEKDERGQILKDSKGRVASYKRLENADTAVKGAASDMLKKSATLVGVALYLAEKAPEKKREEMARPMTREPQGKAVTTPHEKRGSEAPAKPPKAADGLPAQKGQLDAIQKLARQKGLDHVALEAECLKTTGEPMARLTEAGARVLISALNNTKRK